MVNRYKPSQFISLLEFCRRNSNKDFFFTKNNIRYYVKDDFSLKELLKDSQDIFIYEANDIEGVILRWRSIGNDISRYYVKLHAKTPEIAEKLITVLLWSCKNKLYVKINKESPFLSVFKHKGFKFFHFRGRELLLRKGHTNHVNDNNTK